MNAITSPEIQTMTAVQIREQFAQKREQGLRAKDAAEALQLSEGAVIAAHGGEHERTLKALPLRAEWLDILKGLEACGTVMALTMSALVSETTIVTIAVSHAVGTACAQIWYCTV